MSASLHVGGSAPHRLVVLVALALLVGLLPAGTALADAPHTDFPGDVGTIVERSGDGFVPTLRFRGEHRFDTAHLIAEDTFTDPDTVLIARGNLFPDSLSGNYLAGQLGAPILLTPTESLTPVTQHALDSLDPDDVILLGSTEAISGEVQTQLSGQGYNVSRIGGIDRYETAADIATRPGNTVGGLSETATATAVVASGDNFPDALVSGAVSYDQAFPLLLTYQDHLPDVTIAALESLNIDSVLIPGGTVPVGAEVEAELEAMGIDVTRLFGTTRVDTALEIAQFAIDNFGWDFSTLAFARGDDFADALTIGPRQGSREDVLLLTNTPSNVGQNNLDFLAERACQMDRVDLAGGYVAITLAAEDQIRTAATGLEGCDVTLTPETATNFVGEPHTVTATVTNNAGAPAEGAEVTFTTTVETGAAMPVPESATATTDADGRATFTTTSDTPGTVTITACISTQTAGQVCANATKTWEPRVPAVISLTPESATNVVGDPHPVTATVTDAFDVGVEGVEVAFATTVEAGTANPDPETATATTDASGQASFIHTSTNPGVVTITACFTDAAGAQQCATATKTWEGLRFQTAQGAVLPDDAANQDVWGFGAEEGTAISVFVDTVSDATAFDIEACLSTTTSSGDCFAFGDDEAPCTFTPPAFACPQIDTLLPADTDGDGIYYLLVESGSGASNFAGPIGEYEINLTADPAVGLLVLALDDQPGTF